MLFLHGLSSSFKCVWIPSCPQFFVDIVEFLQTGVALNRIAVFLDEDEVSAQVSSLKKSRLPPSAEELDEDGLGIENGSFKWNEVPEGDDGGEDANKKRSSSTEEVDTAVEEPADRNGEGSGADNGDHRFELRDVDVLFPEGELTVITGPTASGKTALLVSFALYFSPVFGGAEGTLA